MKKMSNNDSDGALQDAGYSQCSQNFDRNGSAKEPQSSRVGKTNAVTNTEKRRKHADSDMAANVTSDFSSLIAKKLTDILDKLKAFLRLKVAVIQKANGDHVQTKEKGGIKLFASSETVLKDAAADDTPTELKRRKKPDLLKAARKAKSARLKFTDDSEDEDEDAKLASVVVSADWVRASTN